MSETLEFSRACSSQVEQKVNRPLEELPIIGLKRTESKYHTALEFFKLWAQCTNSTSEELMRGSELGFLAIDTSPIYLGGIKESIIEENDLSESLGNLNLDTDYQDTGEPPSIEEIEKKLKKLKEFIDKSLNYLIDKNKYNHYIPLLDKIRNFRTTHEFILNQVPLKSSVIFHQVLAEAIKQIISTYFESNLHFLTHEFTYSNTSLKDQPEIELQLNEVGYVLRKRSDSETTFIRFIPGALVPNRKFGVVMMQAQLQAMLLRDQELNSSLFWIHFDGAGVRASDNDILVESQDSKNKPVLTTSKLDNGEVNLTEMFGRGVHAANLISSMTGIAIDIIRNSGDEMKVTIWIQNPQYTDKLFENLANLGQIKLNQKHKTIQASDEEKINPGISSSSIARLVKFMHDRFSGNKQQYLKELIALIEKHNNNVGIHMNSYGVSLLSAINRLIYQTSRTPINTRNSNNSDNSATQATNQNQFDLLKSIFEFMIDKEVNGGKFFTNPGPADTVAIQLSRSEMVATQNPPICTPYKHNQIGGLGYSPEFLAYWQNASYGWLTSPENHEEVSPKLTEIISNGLNIDLHPIISAELEQGKLEPDTINSGLMQQLKAEVLMQDVLAKWFPALGRASNAIMTWIRTSPESSKVAPTSATSGYSQALYYAYSNVEELRNSVSDLMELITQLLGKMYHHPIINSYLRSTIFPLGKFFDAINDPESSFKPIAIYITELKSMKPVNEAIGHMPTDAVIKEIARLIIDNASAVLAEHGLINQANINTDNIQLTEIESKMALLVEYSRLDPKRAKKLLSATRYNPIKVEFQLSPKYIDDLILYINLIPKTRWPEIFSDLNNVILSSSSIRSRLRAMDEQEINGVIFYAKKVYLDESREKLYNSYLTLNPNSRTGLVASVLLNENVNLDIISNILKKSSVDDDKIKLFINHLLNNRKDKKNNELFQYLASNQMTNYVDKIFQLYLEHRCYKDTQEESITPGILRSIECYLDSLSKNLAQRVSDQASADVFKLIKKIPPNVSQQILDKALQDKISLLVEQRRAAESSAYITLAGFPALYVAVHSSIGLELMKKGYSIDRIKEVYDQLIQSMKISEIDLYKAYGISIPIPTNQVVTCLYYPVQTYEEITKYHYISTGKRGESIDPAILSKQVNSSAAQVSNFIDPLITQPDLTFNTDLSNIRREINGKVDEIPVLENSKYINEIAFDLSGNIRIIDGGETFGSEFNLINAIADTDPFVREYRIRKLYNKPKLMQFCIEKLKKAIEFKDVTSIFFPSEELFSDRLDNYKNARRSLIAQIKKYSANPNIEELERCKKLFCRYLLNFGPEIAAWINNPNRIQMILKNDLQSNLTTDPESGKSLLEIDSAKMVYWGKSLLKKRMAIYRELVHRVSQNCISSNNLKLKEIDTLIIKINSSDNSGSDAFKGFYSLLETYKYELLTYNASSAISKLYPIPKQVNNLISDVLDEDVSHLSLNKQLTLLLDAKVKNKIQILALKKSNETTNALFSLLSYLKELITLDQVHWQNLKNSVDDIASVVKPDLIQSENTQQKEHNIKLMKKLALEAVTSEFDSRVEYKVDQDGNLILRSNIKDSFNFQNGNEPIDLSGKRMIEVSKDSNGNILSIDVHKIIQFNSREIFEIGFKFNSGDSLPRLNIRTLSNNRLDNHNLQDVLNQALENNDLFGTLPLLQPINIELSNPNEIYKWVKLIVSEYYTHSYDLNDNKGLQHVINDLIQSQINSEQLARQAEKSNNIEMLEEFRAGYMTKLIDLVSKVSADSHQDSEPEHVCKAGKYEVEIRIDGRAKSIINSFDSNLKYVDGKPMLISVVNKIYEKGYESLGPVGEFEMFVDLANSSKINWKYNGKRAIVSGHNDSQIDPKVFLASQLRGFGTFDYNKLFSIEGEHEIELDLTQNNLQRTLDLSLNLPKMVDERLFPEVAGKAEMMKMAGDLYQRFLPLILNNMEPYEIAEYNRNPNSKTVSFRKSVIKSNQFANNAFKSWVVLNKHDFVWSDTPMNPINTVRNLEFTVEINPQSFRLPYHDLLKLTVSLGNNGTEFFVKLNINADNRNKEKLGLSGPGVLKPSSDLKVNDLYRYDLGHLLALGDSINLYFDPTQENFIDAANYALSLVDPDLKVDQNLDSVLSA